MPEDTRFSSNIYGTLLCLYLGQQWGEISELGSQSFLIILVECRNTLCRIRTEQGEILRISPYSVQMRENVDQNNSEYGHFSRRNRY